MSNNIPTKKTPNTYDAGDMADLALSAESDMRWMSIIITDAKKRLQALKNELKTEHVQGLYAFEHVLDMYQYLAEERLNSYINNAERYTKEWEKDEKAVTL